MSLKKYKEKRDFRVSPEPSGKATAKAASERDLLYVIQKHRASQLHYDFRLEFNGVLLSWAVPKGPSLDPTVKRLAMQVEDHPVDYASFEGVIPEGEYGGGTVMVWDNGQWIPESVDVAAALQKGDLKFTLLGKKLRGSWVLVRTRNSPSTLANAFRREVQALDPDLPLYGPMPIEERMERFWDSRFYGAVFLIFAAVALLLASIGLYTVVAHAVSQRTQEIGIRMAVGATARDVLKLVFIQGMLPLSIGLTIGLAGSLAVNRVLKSMLVQVSPSDPITLAVASGVLVLSATLGCWIPARRAMQVDPVVALRHE